MQRRDCTFTLEEKESSRREWETPTEKAENGERGMYGRRVIHLRNYV